MEWEGLGRLALAVGLSFLIGLDRELKGHEAGLRTHVSVALGAALIGVMVTLGFRDYSPVAGSRADAARASTQVIVGIGFLGAGAIVRTGNRVRGLTTAATLWVTASIGLACGVGSIGPAIAATLMLALL